MSTAEERRYPLPCPVDEYAERCRAAMAEAGWPSASVSISPDRLDVSIEYLPGMPDDLVRTAHAVAHGMHPDDYTPCAWCYSMGHDACADGDCRAPRGASEAEGPTGLDSSTE